MVAATYGIAPAGKARVKAKSNDAAKAGPIKSWYARLLDALIESRTQQARREIARHVHLSAYSLDNRSDRLVKTGAKDMPFGGW